MERAFHALGGILVVVGEGEEGFGERRQVASREALDTCRLG